MTEKINKFLRSEAALLTLLAMALISQTPHTAVLFHRLSPEANGIADIATWLHAAAYAIALEFATLVFVVRGQRRLAWLFALVSIVVNLLYYAQASEMNLIYILSTVMVSVALPVSIAFYSDSVADSVKHSDALPDTTSDAIALPVAAETIEIAQPSAMSTVAIAQPAERTKRKPGRKPSKNKLTPGQRQAQIAESGLEDANEIARQYNVSLRTAHNDIAALRGMVNGK